MKIMKKALVMLLVCLIAVSLLPLSVFAAGTDGERAERFLAVVAKLNNCTGLVEREAVYNEATSPDVYFDDESYEGVSEALLALERVRLAVEASVAFVDAIDRLEEVGEDGYVALRALLDEATGYYNSLTDKSYTGVSGAYERYSATLSALITKERYTADIIALGEALLAAVSYSEISSLVREIEEGMRNESFIADHPSAEVLTEALSAADETVRAAIVRANLFIRAVDGITRGEGYLESLLAARDALVGVDATVGGVSNAKRVYTDSLKDYNSSAARVNSTFD